MGLLHKRILTSRPGFSKSYFRKKLKTYMTKIEITLKKNPIFTDRIHHKLIANYTI